MVAAVFAAAGSLGVPEDTKPQPDVEAGTEARTEVQIADASALRARMVAVEADASLAGDVRAGAVELYRAAIEERRKLDEANARQERADAAIREAPALSESIRRDLAQPPVELPIEVADDASVEVLEQALLEQESELREARSELAFLTDEPNRRAERRQTIPQAITAARQQLTRIEAEISRPDDSSTPLVLVEARRALQELERAALSREILALERELYGYDARSELLPLRRQRAARRVALASTRVDRWRDIVNTRRRTDAEDQDREAARAAALALPEIAGEALENARLTQERRELTASIETASEALEGAWREFRLVDDTASRIDRKVRAAGLTDEMGFLLRRERARLPELGSHRASERETAAAIARTQVRLVDLDETGLELDRLEATLATHVNRLVVPDDGPTPEQISSELRTILQARVEIVDKLREDHDEYYQTLLDLRRVENAIIAETENIRSYIDRRVLWIRSSSVTDLLLAWDGAIWLLSPRGWHDALAALIDGLRAEPFSGLVAGLGFLLWSVLVPRLRRLRQGLGERAAQNRTDEIAPTLLATIVTIAIAAIAPVFYATLAWFFTATVRPPEHALAAARGLVLVALVGFPIQMLRQTIKPNGLALAHFGWTHRNVQIVRRHLTWLGTIALPAAFIAAAALHPDEEQARREALGRVAAIVVFAALTVFLHRVMHPATGLLHERIATHRNGWLARLRHVWFSLILAVPAALIVAVVLGYYYTARELGVCLLWTAWLVLALHLSQSIVLRWFLLLRRRLAIAHAKARREALAQQTSAAQHGDAAASAGVALPATAGVDLGALNTQTARLVRSFVCFLFVLGAWWIWIDVLPALGILDDVRLGWTKTTYELEAPATDAAEHGRGNGPTSDAADARTPSAGAVKGGIAPATSDARAGTPVAVGASAPSPSEPVTTEPLPRALGGSSPPRALVEREQPVTLADLLLAVAIGVLTWIAGRNLPAFLQISVLQRLPIDAGARYAIGAVTSYAIVLVGFVIAFQMIGIGWAKVQWLAAALTVGLGFGLQEIFANFVSGIIILVERPIRVGDTVTIGTVSGTVSQIRIRATVIVDWDRKELLVPNREFVTGQVVNWTLTDPITRVVIPVGVAYGSDTENARDILVGVARQHARILAEPAPRALFLRFGDSTLDLELRAFVRAVEDIPTVRNDLNTAIDRAFRAAGIEIAFPQRDIHVRSVPPHLLDGRARDRDGGETVAIEAPADRDAQ